MTKKDNNYPPGLRRAPDGRPGYQIRFRDQDGKRRTETLGSYAEAKATLHARQTALQRNEYVTPERGRVRFGEFAAQVENMTRGRRANTKERDEMVLRTRLLPVFGARPMGRITRLEVQSWVKSLEDEGLAPATVHKMFRLFARVFDEAVDDGIIAASPCRKISLPSIVRNERFTLEPPHVQAIADAVPARFRALVLTAAATGLRWGELVGLRVSRLDMLRREIDVAETLVEMSNGQFTFGRPKTKKSRSRVSFPVGLSAVLAAHLDKYGPRTARGARDRDGMVFTASTGAYLRRSNFRHNVWQPALAAVGLPADVHSTTLGTLALRCSSTAVRHRSRCRRSCDTRGRQSRSTRTRTASDASMNAPTRCSATRSSAARGVLAGYKRARDASQRRTNRR